MTDPILCLGREMELEQIEAVLQRRRPACIVIAGPPGIGKKTVQQTAAIQAQKAGWLALPALPDRLVVNLDTTVRQFEQGLRQFTMALVEKRREETTVSAYRDDHGALASADVINGLRELAQQPLLLLLNRYKPNAAFATYFGKQFVPNVLRTNVPLVVVLAAFPDDAAALQSVATTTIDLRELRTDVLCDYLSTLELEPELTDTEIDVYCKALARNPILLHHLTRVLALTRADGR